MKTQQQRYEDSVDRNLWKAERTPDWAKKKGVTSMVHLKEVLGIRLDDTRFMSAHRSDPNSQYYRLDKLFS